MADWKKQPGLELTSNLALGGLIGSTIITIIGSLEDTVSQADLQKKNVLTIESAVNIIAGYLYFEIVKYLKNGNWKKANDLRYLDWFLTTPLLILSFIYFIRSKSKAADTKGEVCNFESRSKKIQEKTETCKYPWWQAMVAILLTYAMLAFGAAGRSPGGKQNEFNWINFMGFVSFFGLATMLYFIYPDPDEDQFVAISIFLLVWIAYGAVYYLKPEGIIGRESLYNCLDLVSKSGFGLLMFFFM